MSHQRILSTLAGLGAGLAAATLVFFTVGVPGMFTIFWGCVPEHNVHPETVACSRAVVPLTLLGVAAVCLLAAWPIYRWAKRAAARYVAARARSVGIGSTRSARYC